VAGSSSIELHQADAALAKIAQRGLFAVEREAEFDSLTHCTFVEEMRTEQINAIGNALAYSHQPLKSDRRMFRSTPRNDG